MMFSTLCSPSSSEEKNRQSSSVEYIPSTLLREIRAKGPRPGNIAEADHNSLVADDANPRFCSAGSSAFARAAVGLFKWIAQMSYLTRDLVRKSSAHCPARSNPFLCPLLQSRTKAPWPSCFLRISDTCPLGAVLHTCSPWSPILLPSTPWIMA